MKIRTVLFAIFLGTGMLFAKDWQTDLKIAKELSKAGNKSIILVFQGSDWCGPGIKLDKKIWSSEEFQNYAADHFVMLLTDFPQKKQNRLPPEQKNKNSLFRYIN